MSLVINHNLMATNAARNLDNSYGALATSTRRLSSGLRITSAADDAAGLAIRELMRSDVSTMNQGIRNANDAVSMIQTADGALQVVDEKLIRMKELAEQASTGTYTSDQRLIIDSEFVAMASEIQRISMATNFNNINLLDGTLDGSRGSLFGEPMIIHFGTGNSSSEDYYDLNVNSTKIQSLFDYFHYNSSYAAGASLQLDVPDTMGDDPLHFVANGINAAYKADIPVVSGYGSSYNEDLRVDTPASVTNDARGFTVYYDTGTPGWSITSTGTPAAYPNADILGDAYGYYVSLDGTFNTRDISQSFNNRIDVMPDPSDPTATIPAPDTSVTFNLYPNWSFLPPDTGFSSIPEYPNAVITDTTSLNGPPSFEIDLDGRGVNQIKGSFLSGTNGVFDADAQNLPDLKSQEGAAVALDRITQAIVSKDKVRANLGATQNRLENTITNLEIQAENLMASESQISDVDVASEMTEFVRQQILTQSAVAMLAQANSLPKMAMQLISG